MRYKNLSKISNTSNWNDTAQHILDTAAKLFMENGYKNVTTRQIAAAAEVNLGLIPYYFKSKYNLAKEIYLNLLEELTLSMDYDMSTLTEAEKIYASSLLMWYYLDEDESKSRFYYEFIEYTNELDTYTPSFIASTWQIIKSYNLNISELDNSLYLMVMKATEKALILKVYKKEINITYNDVVEILISNYLFNIGISDKEISKIISNAQKYCEEVTLKPVTKIIE